MATDLTGFTFPSKAEQLDVDGVFPMLEFESEKYGDFNHPVIDALKEHKIFQSLTVISDWKDDRQICVEVAIVVDGKKYGFSAWWITQTMFKTFIRAECKTNMHEQDEVTKFILEHDTLVSFKG
jgi:hypothetical protein